MSEAIKERWSGVGCADGCGTSVVTLSSEDARNQIATLTAERDKLQSEKAKLLEVLRPFAFIADEFRWDIADVTRVGFSITGASGFDAITLGDLRAAATLIKELTPPPSQKE